MEVGITPAGKESLHLKISCTLLPMEQTLYALKKHRFAAEIVMCSINGYLLPCDMQTQAARPTLYLLTGGWGGRD